MRFEFATDSRIIFGAGTIDEVGSLALQWGKRVLVATGSHPERAQRLLDILDNAGMGRALFSVPHEPTIAIVQEGVRLARLAACDMAIGFGGGSAIDAGKAIAAMLTNEGDLLDYLEVIGRGQKISKPSAPYIAIPTTAGTGAEVTRNAVLSSPEHQTKVSLRSRYMLPLLAVVDPELTYSLPPDVTAFTGLDALTQLIEPYVSHLANPLTDALCREGMSRVARSLRNAYHNDRDKAARQGMAIASLFGGLALANAKLGAVHGLAGPLGGMVSAPHGALCAALLPAVMAENVCALEKRQPEGEALQRYADVGAILIGDPGATPADACEWTGELCRDLGVLALGAYGLTENEFPILITKAKVSSSMRGNPIQLTDDELKKILLESS